MPFHDIPVPSRTLEEIEAISDAWLGQAVYGESGRLNIFALLESARVEVVERSASQMGEEVAYACPTTNRVFARDTLLLRAREGAPDAVFALAHELAHVVLHRGAERKALKVDGNSLLGFIRPEESAEHQASQFARALLMPRPAVSRAPSAQALATTCGVPISQALERMREAAPPTKREVPAAATAFLAVAKGLHRQKPNADELDRHRERLALWHQLETIPGENPAASRKCGRWRVCWSEYKKMTECGWDVRAGRIVVWLDLQKD